MTQRNGTIAPEHATMTLRQKRLLFSKRTKPERFKSKKSGHYYFLF